MSYQAEHLEMEDAILTMGKYHWGLFYRPSEVTLCRIADMDTGLISDSQEIRLFSETEELHIFLDQDRKAVHIKEEDTDHTLTKAYTLNGKFARSTGKNTLVVRQYLEEDEDGQVYIALTRLVDVR